MAFTAVSYVCASCLSLTACSCSSRADLFLLIAQDNGAEKPGQGAQERNMGGKAKKVVPGQSQELIYLDY